MGSVTVLPGIDPAHVRPRARTIEELDEDQRALVIRPNRHGFAIMLRPQVVSTDSEPRGWFIQARHALQYARRLSACDPLRFPLVIDESGANTRSLSAILGDADPMGFAEERR